ncbi:MAG: hypothetical protein U0T75_09555 [Chitinophagales bacterium]
MSMNPQAFTEEDIAAYVKAYSLPGAIRSPINYYRATFRKSERSSFAKNKSACADALGEHDKALGKELTYNTAKYCEQEPTILYDSYSGHFVQHDNPGWVNAELLKFFRGS